MAFYFTESEIQRTYKLHFERPLRAPHPEDPKQEISFRDAFITLAAIWDPQAQKWKAKPGANGKPPALAFIAPQAKRVLNGKLSKFDAFWKNGKVAPVPIPLDSIEKQAWDDQLKDEIRRNLVSVFWAEVFTGQA